MRSIPLSVLGAVIALHPLSGIDLVILPSQSVSEEAVVDIEEAATVAELQCLLDGMYGDNGPWTLLAMRSNQSCPCPQAGYQWDTANGARDFYYNPSPEDKQNIAYVVKTLANKNEISLLFYKNTIESSGAKVNHVHPLKFLQTIFTDEELKIGMRNIRRKSLVWKSFRDGIADSLTDETNNNNMLHEYLPLFASAVQVDINMIAPLYQQRNWCDFIEALVTHVPRREDPRRYDF